MDLVVGATGYVGGLLVERLTADGRGVRALAREPSTLATSELVEPVRANLLEGRGLKRAIDGTETAYYLVHSMESPGEDSADFRARDRRAARNFARAARAAGVARVVYLGGVVPSDGRVSPHLSSRLEVEGILLRAVPGSTALRASILIGARLLVVPRSSSAWSSDCASFPCRPGASNRTQPIDERDAIEYLARTPRTPAAAGRSLDIVGPDVLSYAAMIERIAELMGVGRTPLPLRRLADAGGERGRERRDRPAASSSCDH